MKRLSTWLGLAGLGLAGGWGIAAARLRFGAVPDRVLLIFDGSCGVCTRTMRYLRALDRGQRLTALPAQQPGLPEQHHLTGAQCEPSVWAVMPDGWAFPAAGREPSILSHEGGESFPRARGRWLPS